MNTSTFKIYNASAGSGKTYALAKNYLELLLAAEHSDLFKHVLAITFTNKAVGEMKSRILHHLVEFSSSDILSSTNSMFLELCDRLEKDKTELHHKSKSILKRIVHNYAAFEISTIDKFTQKLIRAFAHDLNLPINFNVELDEDAILREAIDNLIARTGKNKQLTEVLVNYALTKADNDRSYNIEFDLLPVAQMLRNENHFGQVKALNNKSLKDFQSLKTKLNNEIPKIASNIKEIANDVLHLLADAGLQQNDFNSGYLPKHFVALSKGNYSIKFTNKWQEQIATHPLYPQRVSDATKSAIDGLQSNLVDAFLTSKDLANQIKFHEAALKNLTPLSVLNEIAKEVEIIKNENNSLLISEFNSIVSEHLRQQPVAYIYERIGEKFKHFFIDEFQDTSVLQWQNLQPLICNALAAENTSAMLVGDAKQSIYRWRGGKAEQFINLYQGQTNPCQIPSEVINLKNNYRSCKAIVEFNNKLFEFVSQSVFDNASYSDLYSHSQQEVVEETEGFVQLSFLSLENEDKDEVYPKEVLHTLESCLSNGYDAKDICILVRKRDQGVAIANYLIEHSDIDVISSETLLLTNSDNVTFIINLIAYLINSGNDSAKLVMLNFIADKIAVEDKHSFIASHLKRSQSELFESLKQHGILFNPENSTHFALYELVETIISSFSLTQNSDAYLQHFLDVVLDYTLGGGDGVLGFLDYFDSHKDKLSITSSPHQNAVQIMTIHKTKGLEFPVVIFPYADIDIYYEKQHFVWYPVSSQLYNGFDNVLLTYNKSLLNFDTQGEHLYYEHRSELELDNINLLYVSLTRAIEQLYIISNDRSIKSSTSSSLYYSQILKRFLTKIDEWEDDKKVYHFGTSKRNLKNEMQSKHENLKLEQMMSSPLNAQHVNFVAKSGLLWDTKQESAIEKGNLIHAIMALIKSEHDVDFAFAELHTAGQLSEEQTLILKPIIIQVIRHPQLARYFTQEYVIHNERELILSNGNLLKPDRLILKANQAIVLDYKTGVFKKEHIAQVNGYASAMESLGFNVVKRILVYINDTVDVKEI